jgi:hypothetical protein
MYQEDFGTDPDAPPHPNFSAFLASHATLLHLTLLGADLPKYFSVSFPCLRSFERSFEDSALICNCQPPLETLVISFLHRVGSDQIFPSFHAVPLTNNLNLTKLKIDAVDDAAEAVKLKDKLSSASPNLINIDLDICIGKPMERTRVRVDRQKSK